MMTYDQFLTRGLSGAGLWETIKHKCVSHNDILAEMRQRQQQLGVYSKHPVGVKGVAGIDQIEESLLNDIKFLETMAWRVYMFGKRNLFSIRPGSMGEFLKRKRNDPAYWKMRVLIGEKKADKKLKSLLRREWEATILRKYSY